MPKVEVVYASRHGSTAGIALWIADELRSAGVEVEVADAADRPAVEGFDAYVIGSAIYMGSWLKDGVEFLARHESVLAKRPVWLFSSGPLPGSSKTTDETDPLVVALGPEEGPGSGGHKKIARLSAAIQPREHRVFLGAFDPYDPPKTLPERFVRLLPISRDILPVGDFRDRGAVQAWAREISASLSGVQVA
jgi:menaquinone-dependent protoporphyrinogen oxidase